MKSIIENYKEDFAIRANWDLALSSVEYGYELSDKIGWGFSSQDLVILSYLHRIGKNRRKIEELLTDCNYHNYSSYLTKGAYEEYEAEILEEYE